MQSFNKITLNITVAILDYLYRGRDIQRFWVLEEIARAPYFSFLSVLHFRESMGLRGPEHLYLMEEHFKQTVNETEHLEEMEILIGLIAFLLVIWFYSTIGLWWFTILLLLGVLII